MSPEPRGSPASGSRASGSPTSGSRTAGSNIAWIVSAPYDLAFIVGPAVFALAVVALCPQVRAEGAETPLWAWVACILAVDVAHVWSTLYRTYLDPVERARRPLLYIAVPLLCLVTGVVAYSIARQLFWRALAYVAVLHFVRQQYGLVALYGHRGGWTSRADPWIDKAAIYAATIYPMIVWHTQLPRPFVWFTPGDFIALPAWLAPVSRVAWIAALAVFAARQLYLVASGIRPSPGRILVVATTAASWWVGIVACEADWAFTLTNVLAHGIPYMALIWIYNHRKHARGTGLLARLANPAWVPVFLGLLVLLAWGEEALWDNVLWHERAAIFGDVRAWFAWADSHAALSVLVPLLTLPQATHYVLDAFLWRFDGSNPDLAENLFGAPVTPARRA